QIVCTEQFSTRVMILDADKSDWNNSEATVWDFDPFYNVAIPDDKLRHFGAMSEVKPVKNMTELLITASGGAVALVRIADGAVRFCEFAGGNTHSAELLPDGNIVTASSSGNYLRLFRVSEASHSDYEMPDAHGVVWDKKRGCLWSSGEYGIVRWEYDGRQLIHGEDFLVKPGTPFYGHDLFPVLGEDLLYLSGRALMFFDPGKGSFEEIYSGAPYIKSISKSADGQVLVTTPKEHWWSDSVCRLDGECVNIFRTKTNMRFYKARWMMPNCFSYDETI
ncbi:MAG: DUF6528 family protein, partial [Victivallaceae bacterium]